MIRKLAVPIVVAAALLTILSYKLFHPGPPNQDIRIGWQTAWATQGQIIQAMVHTNIAQRYGLNPQFRSFQYGPDLNQAALTGDIDCTNSGIVPATILLDKSDGKWIIVARMVDFPISVVARPDSGVHSISDLKGHNFAVPLGGGSHPYALQLLRDNGLVMGEGPEKVRVKNVQPTEMALAMNQKSVEASAVWEPVRSLLLRGRLGSHFEAKRPSINRIIASLIMASLVSVNHS